AIVGREEQRLTLGRVAVELGELLAVLALRHDPAAGRRRTLLEPTQTRVEERQPVSALRELPFVDDVDAARALLLDDPVDIPPQRLVVMDGAGVEIGRA